MKDNVKNILGVSLAVSSLVFAFSALFWVNGFLNSRAPVKTFAVSAEGEIVAIPDIAEFNYAVITEGGEDLVQLQEENSARSNRVNSYLIEQGTSKEDIKTTGYNINPRYQYFSCSSKARVCPPPEIVGYTITHSVQVKVRELTKAGLLFSGIVASGANSASQLSFSIDDLEKVQSQARDIAIQKAKEKAKNIADSAGVKLVRIVSINESFQAPFPLRDFGGAFPATESAPPVIEPGSQDVKITVSLVYEIR